MSFPPTGRPADEVLADLEEARSGDVDPSTGRLLTGIYEPSAEAAALAREAYGRFLGANALYIDLYPSLVELEREVVAAVAELVRGEPGTVGNVTSGGTESIMLAVKTARDRARARRPDADPPQMVLPVTAHPAFHKAAHYLGVEPVVTPVGADFRADVDAVRRAVTDRTILVVGSAPCYSHGVVDPIPELGAVAADAAALLHVDGCVGAIPLGIMRLMGEDVPDFDFAVPTVSTISADLHKYGYVPKNASVLLYRDASLRRFAWYVNTSTTEYAVINPTVQSTRSGGPVAAAWALIHHLGLEGYVDLTRRVLDTTRRMIDGVTEIPEVEVLGEPVMTMFTLASDTINVFELHDVMRERGWNLLPEFAAGGSPANLHVGVSFGNVGSEEAFLADLAAAAAQVRDDPRVDVDEIAAAVADVAGLEPLQAFAELAPIAGLTGDGLPQRMGALNTILDRLPPDLRDELLTDYVNLML